MNAKKRKKQIYGRLTVFFGRVMVKSYDGKHLFYNRPGSRVVVYWPIP